jgi:predicted transcriptional regulator
MQIKDLDYKDEYIVVKDGDGIQQVAKKMLENYPSVGAAIVVDSQGVPHGIIYLYQLTWKGVVEGNLSASAADTMARNILKVKPEDDVKAVQKSMAETQPFGIVVFDTKVRGFVSPYDWAEVLQKIK